MVFFTPAWTSASLVEVGRRLWGWLRPRCGVGVLWLLLTFACVPVWAEGNPVEVGNLTLERSEDGLFLSTNVKFELPGVVEDVLRKGIPVFFVAEAELKKDRWYWYDKRMGMATRHMRLAFQPLLRRWRLQVAPTPIGNNGLGVTLSQNFDALADALGAVQRFSRWKVADTADLEPDGRYSVEFSFRLDVSQLPRPFQIGALGQADWSMSATRSQKLPPESAR